MKVYETYGAPHRPCRTFCDTKRNVGCNVFRKGARSVVSASGQAVSVCKPGARLYLAAAPNRLTLVNVGRMLPATVSHMSEGDAAKGMPKQLLESVAKGGIR